MLIMRGMGAADDAPMVPEWAVEKPPPVSVTVDPKTGRKTYNFEEPIEIDVKTGLPKKSSLPWLPILGVAAAIGVVWAWNKYGRKGRSRPKAFAYA